MPQTIKDAFDDLDGEIRDYVFDMIDEAYHRGIDIGMKKAVFVMENNPNDNAETLIGKCIKRCEDLSQNVKRAQEKIKQTEANYCDDWF